MRGDRTGDASTVLNEEDNYATGADLGKEGQEDIKQEASRPAPATTATTSDTGQQSAQGHAYAIIVTNKDTMQISVLLHAAYVAAESTPSAIARADDEHSCGDMAAILRQMVAIPHQVVTAAAVATTAAVAVVVAGIEARAGSHLKGDIGGAIRPILGVRVIMLAAITMITMAVQAMLQDLYWSLRRTATAAIVTQSMHPPNATRHTAPRTRRYSDGNTTSPRTKEHHEDTRRRLIHRRLSLLYYASIPAQLLVGLTRSINS
jgi:hypothetical protein